MAVDYDLVIMGGTDAARWGATIAAQYHARVALVGRQQYCSGAMAMETAASLANLGVDVVESEWTFVQQPHLQIQTEGRVLRSRHYLLAFSPPPQVPDPSYFNIDEAYAAVPSHPKAEWLILGASPAALQLSQFLVNQSHSVTLVAPSQLLPAEEPEAALLIQAQLEVDGVRILTHTPPDQILEMSLETSPQIKKVWGQEPPANPSPLLQPLGLTYSNLGLWVNAHLRTSHPRIYACGPLLGGYDLPHIARYEASIAVRNALFLPTRSINYDHLPWAILTQPALARVGLTTAQAQQQYGQIKVLQQTYQTLDAAYHQGQTTGLCRLIALRTGVLVGAHVVGAAAAELIHWLASAVQQRRTLQDIAHWPFIASTFSDIILQTAQERHPQRDVLESLFYRRRRWNL